MATAQAAAPAAAQAPPAPSRREAFLGVFKQLKAEILAADMLKQPDASSWMERMIDYNVPGGKLNRGLSVHDTLLSAKPDATEEEQLQADRIGWAIEFLQAYFLVADDIMDSSITRRGHPCWYRVPDVGMVAINDGILLEQLIYFVLKKHLKTHSAYVPILELFLETTHQTAHGQLLDLITAPIGTVDLNKYTLSRYMDIVTYKTAFYSFYLPVACGLHLAGMATKDALATAERILVKMGQYFQIQDDYLDCFADASVLGKVGTDIQDNKCSWLVCTALQEATPAQRTTIADNYGKDDPESIERVKAVYRELNLTAKFEELEKQSYDELKQMIKDQKHVPEAIFDLFLGKIYKRQK